MQEEYSTVDGERLPPTVPDVSPLDADDPPPVSYAAVNGTAPPPRPTGLAAHHLALLRDASCIAEPLITARGYLSLDDPGDLLHRGFSAAQSRGCAPALGLPLWTVDGQQAGWQVRPDTPRLVRGKAAKYETPRGSRLILDVHPSVQPLLADPTIPLWITEGVRKGDALASKGACGIALNGVWGWMGTNAHGGKKIALVDWLSVPLNDRVVHLVFDSDLGTNPQVRQALDALCVFLRGKQARPDSVVWGPPFQQQKWGVDDYFAAGHLLDDLLGMIPPAWSTAPAPPQAAPAPGWHAQLSCARNRPPHQSIGNFVLAIEHMDHWQPDKCWYDVVREEHMVGTAPILDGDDTAAGVRIEREIKTPVTNIHLVGRALDYVCRQRKCDFLQDWVDSLDTVKVSPLLTGWLQTYAHVPSNVSDKYVEDVSRIIVVGMIARILQPGCQFRSVAILEGPENAGKSKLCKALAGEDPLGRSWHVALSAGMEGKEAHMMLEGALVAELEELSSYRKTDKNRMKALITAQTDSFIPKFANKRVDHPRRTIFIGTVNPDGDKGYLDDQTGNTRYLPIAVSAIDITGFLTKRTQLFAEAKAYYLGHPDDWWQLESEEDAVNEREERRQTGLYEGDALRTWLEARAQLSPAKCTWQEVADQLLMIPKGSWTKSMQMEIAKALRASNWLPQRSDTARYWVPG